MFIPLMIRSINSKQYEAARTMMLSSFHKDKKGTKERDANNGNFHELSTSLQRLIQNESEFHLNSLETLFRVSARDGVRGLTKFYMLWVLE